MCASCRPAQSSAFTQAVSPADQQHLVTCEMSEAGHVHAHLHMSPCPLQVIYPSNHTRCFHGNVTLHKQLIDFVTAQVAVQLHLEASPAEGAVKPLGVFLGSGPVPQTHAGVKLGHGHYHSPVTPCSGIHHASVSSPPAADVKVQPRLLAHLTVWWTALDRCCTTMFFPFLQVTLVTMPSAV